MNNYASVNMNTVLQFQEEVILMDNTIQPDIKLYLQTLLKEANVASSDADVNNRMVEDLYRRLDDYTSMMLMNKLSQEKQQEFLDKSEKGASEEELETFLRSEVPNVEDVFKTIFLDFRNMYLGKGE